MESEERRTQFLKSEKFRKIQQLIRDMVKKKKEAQAQRVRRTLSRYYLERVLEMNEESKHA